MASSATLTVTITKVNIHRDINKVNQHSEFANAAKLKKLPSSKNTLRLDSLILFIKITKVLNLKALMKCSKFLNIYEADPHNIL